MSQTQKAYASNSEHNPTLSGGQGNRYLIWNKHFMFCINKSKQLKIKISNWILTSDTNQIKVM